MKQWIHSQYEEDKYFKTCYSESGIPKDTSQNDFVDQQNLSESGSEIMMPIDPPSAEHWYPDWDESTTGWIVFMKSKALGNLLLQCGQTPGSSFCDS